MKFWNALQCFFTFSVAAGLADMALRSGPLVAIAVGMAACFAIHFLYGMFPRLIGGLFILSWVGAAHMFIIVMRDLTGATENGAAFLNGNVLAIYFIAFVCGVAANFALIRDLTAMRRDAPKDGGEGFEA